MTSVGDNLEVLVTALDMLTTDSKLIFWVQESVGLRKLTPMMENLQDFISTTNDFSHDVKDLSPGSLCIAKYQEDESWYRARVKTANSTTATVFFIDYGNTEIVPTSDVVVATTHLKNRFFRLPAFATRCCLADIASATGDSWGDEVVAYLEENFVNQEFRAQVVEIQGEKLVLSLEAENGSSFSEELKNQGHAVGCDQSVTCNGLSDHCDGISPKYPLSNPPSGRAKAYVSNFLNVNSFSLNFHSKEADLDSLMEEMSQFYISGHGCQLETPAVGNACATTYSADGVYYRAKITAQLSGGQFQVLFVDYGNSEEKHITEIKVLDKKFLSHAPFSMMCQLQGVDLPSSDQANDRFTELTTDKDLEVVLAPNPKSADLFSAQLYDGDLDLNSLLAQEFASRLPASPQLPPAYASSLTLQPAKVLVGESLEVFISYISSIKQFYCQPQKCSDALTELMSSIEDQYASLDPGQLNVTMFCPELPCIAKFSEDESWYRALVREVDGDRVKVYFSDYGNCEWLAKTDVREMKPEFSRLPCCTFPCSFPHDLLLQLGSDSAEVNGYFTEQTTDVPLKALIASQESTGTFVVELTDPDSNSLISQSILNKFGKLNLQKNNNNANSQMPTTYNYFEGTRGCTEEAYMLQVTSCSQFYCQPAKYEGQLESMMANMNIMYNASTDHLRLTSIQPGLPCCALYSEDGMWYRAKVTNVQDGRFEVHFVDFGNSEWVTANEIRKLAPDFIQLPCASIKCSLSPQVKEKLRTTDEVTPYFEELTFDKKLVVKFLDLSSAVYTVELTDADSGENIGTALTAKFATQPSSTSFGHQPTTQTPRAPQPPQPLSYPERQIQNNTALDLYVLRITDLSDFCCQLAGAEHEGAFESLMAQIAEKYDHPNSFNEFACDPPVVEGSSCIAQFSEDGSWYRAKVIQVLGDEIEVVYIDYGNTESIGRDKIRRLVPEFAQAPAYALDCSFSQEILDQLSLADATSYFEETVPDQLVKAKVVGRQGSKYLLCFPELQEQLLAQFAKPTSQPLPPPPRPQEPPAAAAASPVAPQVTRATTGQPTPPLTEQQARPPCLQDGQATTLETAAQQVCLEEAALSSQVYLTSAISPTELWCQPADSHAALNELMEEIDSYYSALPTDADAIGRRMALGTLCVAQFSEDNGWYRGVVTDKGPGSLTIYFLDYGNSEAMPASRVKKIRPKFIGLPAQALKCTLRQMDPATAWAPQVKEALTSLISEGKLMACRPHQTGGAGSYQVDLEADGDLAQRLKLIQQEAELAESSLKLDVAATPVEEDIFMMLQPNDLAKVYISYFESIDRFWCHLADKTHLLEELDGQMNAHYESADVQVLPNPSQGTLCATKSPSNGSWYRAVVNHLSPSGEATLLYIDYGSTESVPASSLKCLLPKYTARYPPLAFQCRLADVDGGGQLDHPKVVSVFQELTSGQKMSAMVTESSPQLGLSLQLAVMNKSKEVDIGSEINSLLALYAAINTATGTESSSPPLSADSPEFYPSTPRGPDAGSVEGEKDFTPEEQELLMAMAKKEQDLDSSRLLVEMESGAVIELNVSNDDSNDNNSKASPEVDGVQSSDKDLAAESELGTTGGLTEDDKKSRDAQVSTPDVLDASQNTEADQINNSLLQASGDQDQLESVSTAENDQENIFESSETTGDNEDKQDVQISTSQDSAADTRGDNAETGDIKNEQQGSGNTETSDIKNEQQGSGNAETSDVKNEQQDSDNAETSDIKNEQQDSENADTDPISSDKDLAAESEFGTIDGLTEDDEKSRDAQVSTPDVLDASYGTEADQINNSLLQASGDQNQLEGVLLSTKNDQENIFESSKTTGDNEDKQDVQISTSQDSAADTSGDNTETSDIKNEQQGSGNTETSDIKNKQQQGSDNTETSDIKNEQQDSGNAETSDMKNEQQDFENAETSDIKNDQQGYSHGEKDQMVEGNQAEKNNLELFENNQKTPIFAISAETGHESEESEKSAENKSNESNEGEKTGDYGDSNVQMVATDVSDKDSNAVAESYHTAGSEDLIKDDKGSQTSLEKEVCPSDKMEDDEKLSYVPERIPEKEGQISESDQLENIADTAEVMDKEPGQSSEDILEKNDDAQVPGSTDLAVSERTPEKEGQVSDSNDQSENRADPTEENPVPDKSSKEILKDSNDFQVSNKGIIAEDKDQIPKQPTEEIIEDANVLIPQSGEETEIQEVEHQASDHDQSENKGIIAEDKDQIPEQPTEEMIEDADVQVPQSEAETDIQEVKHQASDHDQSENRGIKEPQFT